MFEHLESTNYVEGVILEHHILGIAQMIGLQVRVDVECFDMYTEMLGDYLKRAWAGTKFENGFCSEVLNLVNLMPNARPSFHGQVVLELVMVRANLLFHCRTFLRPSGPLR